MKRRFGGAALVCAAALLGCGHGGDDVGTGGTGSMPQTGGTGTTAGTGGTGGTGGTVAGTSGGGAGGVAGSAAAGAGAGGTAGDAGGAGAPAGGASGGLAGAAGMGGAGAGGVAGQSGAAGMGGDANLPPGKLSETGLFTSRDAMGNLTLATGVREFQPKYWLWSDGADKKRYVFLPAGAKIDTTDADHWVFPAGTKFWKSFISNGQLVETRLIERTGDGPNDWRFSTYAWTAADAVDAQRMEYKNLLLNAFGTDHDIPNGIMCERCHNALKERALGFGALQLNHSLGGVTLQTLLDEDLLTVPIPTTIKFPGADQTTADILGYFHANCGNCHNDSPGIPVESVPAPQMYLRVLVGDQTLEDTGLYKTAINHASTASADLGLDYRIMGGNLDESAVYYRMNQRMVEDQMPPIGTEMKDMTGLTAIAAWIMSLPPPQ